MYPSTITTFPLVSPTDRLNNPSHSALENLQSSTIGQIQAVIGTSASTLGTIIGDLRNSLSDGGGHVQTAVKGGTGQTTFNKGDLLVGQSSSVLTKLAVSATTNDVLVADPAQAVGMKWAANPNSNKVAVNTSSVVVSGTVLQPLFSASIAGSTLGTSNAVKFRGEVRRFGAGDDFVLLMTYGPNSVFVGTAIKTTDSSVMNGFIEGAIMPMNNSSVLQIGYAKMTLTSNKISALGPTMNFYGSGQTSVNSSAHQDLIISANYVGNNSLNSIVTGTFIVEKIT